MSGFRDPERHALSFEAGCSSWLVLVSARRLGFAIKCSPEEVRAVLNSTITMDQDCNGKGMVGLDSEVDGHGDKIPDGDRTSAGYPQLDAVTPWQLPLATAEILECSVSRDLL